jgi:hypothetical protein
MLPYLGPELDQSLLAKQDAPSNKSEDAAPSGVFSASIRRTTLTRYGVRYAQVLILVAQVIRICLM